MKVQLNKSNFINKHNLFIFSILGVLIWYLHIPYMYMVILCFKFRSADLLLVIYYIYRKNSTNNICQLARSDQISKDKIDLIHIFIYTKYLIKYNISLPLHCLEWIKSISNATIRISPTHSRSRDLVRTYVVARKKKTLLI